MTENYTLPADFCPITPQMVFDKAWQKFIIENAPPAYEYGQCRYLTTDGKRCAIGLCVPDGHPAQSYIGSLAAISELWQELFDQGSIVLLQKMQTELHDRLVSSNICGWGRSLEWRKELYEEFALENNLKVPSVAQ